MACELHKRHTPAPLTTEGHHVVPVAFQLITWQPTKAPYPGRDPDGRGMLWDCRMIDCCPTGHRSVHVWIVRFMHALSAEDPQQAFTAAGGAKGGVQARWALQALIRFKQAGGSLQQLVAAGEWGES